MKVRKILICTTAVILIFVMGMACQLLISSKCEDNKTVDSTRESSSTNEEDSVDIYSADYQINGRRMTREETEAMEDEYEENHDFDKPILGLWEPYLGSKKSDYRYEFCEDGRFLIHWYTSYEPHEWVVVTKGTYSLSGDKFYAKLKAVKSNRRETEWDRTIEYIEDGEMKQTYLEYDNLSKSYRTCELILKKIK